MFTTIEQNTFFYQLINSSPIKDAITGDVYKNVRPIGSEKEDCVINTVVMGTGTLQQSVTNVNFHFPNLVDEMPNQARMREVVDVAKQVLEEGYYKDHWFYTELQQEIMDPQTKEWYINFRLRTGYLNK